MSRSKRRRGQRQATAPHLPDDTLCACTLRGAGIPHALRASGPLCAEHQALRFRPGRASVDVVTLDGQQVPWAVEWMLGPSGWVLETVVAPLGSRDLFEDRPVGVIGCCPCHGSTLLRLSYGHVTVLGDDHGQH